MDNKLDEIRQRTEAATPGPWEAASKGNSIQSNAVVSAMYGDGPKVNICSGISPSTTNAAFIAHSREDIPYLLSEVDRLGKMIEGYQHTIMPEFRSRIEALAARAETAEQERDAAVRDIPHICETCAHTDGLSKYALKRDIPEACKGCCPADDKWQWRGQEAGEGEAE